MAIRSILLIAGISMFHMFALAAPPECKEPGAPSGCFNLVPVEACLEAPIYDFDKGRVTYPCGLRLVPKNPKKFNDAMKASPKSFSLAAVAGAGKVAPYKGGSTIKNNGDGTSTIDHGGSGSETINTKDAGKTVKEYEDKGIKITPSK